jgi:four helix bundle protein
MQKSEIRRQIAESRKQKKMEQPARDLKKRTREFALSAIRLYSSLAKTTVAQVIGRQLLRPTTSVGANFRESLRARSKSEYAAKLNLGLMELEEPLYWLELLEESNVAPTLKSQISSLQAESGELCAIFVTLIKQARNGTGG